jgi:hypothetical protein
MAWQMPMSVDCRRGLVKLGQTTGYADPRAVGPAVDVAPAAADWRRPPQGTMLQSAWRAVCDPAFRPPLPARLVAQTTQPQVRVPAPAKTETPAPAKAETPAPPPPAPDRAVAAVEAAQPAVMRISVERSPPRARRTGSSLAQVLSADTAEGAQRELDQLRHRFGGAFEGLGTRIQTAQVGGRTVYRGMVAGFASHGEAQAFCDTLKRGGRDCLAR